MVVAFGQFLPKPIRELPRLGYLINAHASLLPRHRGAAPIARAILAGDAETGVSVMRVEREMDAGAVCLVKRTPIGAERRPPAPSSSGSRALAADAIAEALDLIASGAARFAPQDAARASFAPKLGPEDARLDPALPAAELARRVRALAPRPGAVLQLGAEKLRILAAHAEPRPRRSRRPAASRARRARCASRRATAGSRSSASSARAGACCPSPSSCAASTCPTARGSSGPRRVETLTRRVEAPMPRPTEGRRRGAARPPLGIASRRHAAPTQARLVAARVLERVERARAYADLTLQAALARSPLGPRDRAFATELVYGTLRWRGRLDHLLARVLDRELAALEPGVLTLLRLGAYQILFCDGVPPSAAVDQTVRCARALGAERATGLVNAVLRRLAQQAHTLALPALADDPLAHLEHALGMPRWIAQRWLDALGPEQAAALAEASNAVPPVTARANRARISREALLARLRERFPAARRVRVRGGGHRARPRRRPGRRPRLRGRAASPCRTRPRSSWSSCSRRSPASACSTRAPRPAPRPRRSPSASAPAGLVVALDRSERRLGADRARRAPARPRERHRRSRATPRSRSRTLPGAPFDRILVDAPCSGLGALRRNADARWRLRARRPGAARRDPGCAARFRCVTVLRPGGTLVYSTCTLTSEENDVGGRVLPLADAGGPTSRRRPRSPRRCVRSSMRRAALRTWPHRHGMDGFFAVRMERDA